MLRTNEMKYSFLIHVIWVLICFSLTIFRFGFCWFSFLILAIVYLKKGLELNLINIKRVNSSSIPDITLKMEGCCSFKSLIGGVCGSNTQDRKCHLEIIPLFSCNKDISICKFFFHFSGPEDEVDLILCCPAWFTTQECLSELTICPLRKAWLTMKQTSEPRCRVLSTISNHGEGRASGLKAIKG